ncbi:hypothetical protein P280DRAFT_38013 [Massarina eburnea CBS 473.64]|uniref:Uncharacterized protein n=1 Tax=Massarina eburnea CBS 473.64 TaxID=1395130 RepID=A0A6A6RWF5_9PLEO|nr:hypothetical protein P280DRAFT_38013 [Massarina eburnea CBS 473.64]
MWDGASVRERHAALQKKFLCSSPLYSTAGPSYADQRCVRQVRERRYGRVQSASRMSKLGVIDRFRPVRGNPTLEPRKDCVLGSELTDSHDFICSRRGRYHLRVVYRIHDCPRYLGSGCRLLSRNYISARTCKAKQARLIRGQTRAKLHLLITGMHVRTAKKLACPRCRVRLQRV